MAGDTVKLRTGTMAIFAVDDHRSVILIPASAEVVVLGGDIERDSFIKVRYHGKVLSILSEDIRCGIGLRNAEPQCRSAHWRSPKRDFGVSDNTRMP